MSERLNIRIQGRSTTDHNGTLVNVPLDISGFRNLFQVGKVLKVTITGFASAYQRGGLQYGLQGCSAYVTLQYDKGGDQVVYLNPLAALPGKVVSLDPQIMITDESVGSSTIINAGVLNVIFCNFIQPDLYSFVAGDVIDFAAFLQLEEIKE